MNPWTFFDYITESGRNSIRDWIDGHPQGIRQRLKAALNIRLNELEVVIGPFDRSHGVGQLHGECKGLFEVILKVAKTQYRVVGCYGPRTQGEFTLLAGAVEKDNRFTSPEVCRTAQQRRNRIQDPKHVARHRYD